MALKVGIQLYSVRDEMKKDPINAIRQVAEIGYKNLEFASSNADTDPGVGFGVSVEDMQKLLKEGEFAPQEKKRSRPHPPHQ